MGSVNNYVVEAKDLENSETLQSQALGHLLQDRNLIVLNPTYDNMEAFYEFIYNFITDNDSVDDTKDYYNRYWSDDVDTFLNQFRLVKDEDDMKRLLHAYKAEEGYGPVFDILGLRGALCFMAEPDSEESMEYEETSPDSPAASFDTEDQTPTAEDMQTAKLTHEGLVADGCIEWINEYSTSEAVASTSNSTGTVTLAAESNGNLNTDSAYKITHEFVTYASGTGDKARTTIVDYVWPCHSFVTSRDYIIVQQNVSYHNQDYNCSTSQEEDNWYSRGKESAIYGPYFWDSTVSNKIYNTTNWNPVTGLEDYEVIGTIMPGANPQTTQGSTNYSQGFGLSLSGVSIGASGPTVSVLPGLSWTKGSSRNVADISTERSDIGEKRNGSRWDFLGKSPKWTWKPLWITNRHEIAAPILREQFDATMNFGIEIEPNNDGGHNHPFDIKSYELYTSIVVENDILRKDGTSSLGREVNKYCDPIPTPCRYKTNCVMTTEAKAHSEKVIALEDYLKKKIPDFNNENFDVATLLPTQPSGLPFDDFKDYLKGNLSDSWKGFMYLRDYASERLNKVKAQVEVLRNDIKAAGFGDMQEITIKFKCPSTVGQIASVKIDLTK